MASQEHHIDFSFKGRYYTHGNLSQNTEQLWFVLHGYGQLAKFFIRKFEALDPEKHFVIAPEGLSKFYLEGFEGRIGATWMTRENRLVDIHNYLTFLNTVHASIIKNFDGKAVRTNLLGFSQGAATASRWLVEGNIHFDRLILWAGIFPPDMELKAARNILKKTPVQFIIGNKDEFITNTRIEEMKNIAKQVHVIPQVIRYSGGHQIDSGVLLTL